MLPSTARLLGGGLLLVAATSVACSDHASPAESAGQSSAPIIKGAPSDNSQDAVVLLSRFDTPSAINVASCTGTLLAPNLVLTARHCVSQTSNAGFACDVNGQGTSGGKVTGDFKAETLYFFTGPTRSPIPDSKKAVAHGKEIIHDDATNLCNHDIALVVLDTAIDGAPIAPIRLESPPVEGATFTAVGWGVTTVTPMPNTRQQRQGISIAHVGPFDDPNSFNQVPSNEFQVGESICEGDSGGPALDTDTGAIIGVVSRGGNGQVSQTNPSAGCVGVDTINLYTETTPFKDLIMQAFQSAGAEPWVEGGPDPRLAKFGATCDGNAACRSNICLTDKKTCSQSCADGSKCPSGYECNGSKICAVPAPASSGCAAAPRSERASHDWIALLLGGAGLVTMLRGRRLARSARRE